MLKEKEMIADIIYNRTLEYILKIPKSERKAKGQFFTDLTVARYMSCLAQKNKTRIRICDCGAGSGILTAALCEKLVNTSIRDICFDLYENDQMILPLLKSNLQLLEDFLSKNGKSVTFNIVTENYILNNKVQWNSSEKTQVYDIIISNPPYKKLSKDSEEAIAMESIVKGQPNIYFLFLALSAKLLKDEGELVFINPRSFTTGSYFKAFRKWFTKSVYFTDLHLFSSRNSIFGAESILQEVVILRAVKDKQKPTHIRVSNSNNSTLSNIKEFHVTYDDVIDENDENCFVRIPTNEYELKIIKAIHLWKSNLIQLGFQLKTGPVVDFRTKENLIDKIQSEKEYVPLLWAGNVAGNKISHPVYCEKPQWISFNKETAKLLIQNKDYLIIKRFTTKEEKRRLQVAILNKDQFKCTHFGVENHLNYVTKLDGEFEKKELLGLFVLFNSTILDDYYRTLNGSTQVNANEINNLPLPGINEIKHLGELALFVKDLNTCMCDQILMNCICNDDFTKIESETKFNNMVFKEIIV